MKTMLTASFSLLLVAPSAPGAATIDRFLQIQPIRVCDDAGARCASAPLSTGHTRAVYEQAGVAAIYMPTTTINDSMLLEVDGLADVNRPGNGQSGGALTINTWFVDTLKADPGFVVYGEARVGGNGVVINSSAVDAADRADAVAHEIGHNLGLSHDTFGAGGADNLMTRGADRNAPASGLTQQQIDRLRLSPFVQAAPTVTVDLRGATPFSASDVFDISFDDGPDGVSLTKLTIDLSPAGAFFDVGDPPPGASSGPLSFGVLSGLATSDIGVSGLTDGSQTASFSFAEGAFEKGDRLALGGDIDLLSAMDLRSATPERLVGALLGFEFNIGLSLIAELDSDLVTSSLSLARIGQAIGAPTPLGPQAPQGQLPPIGPIDDPDPVLASPAPIPLPAAIWMLAAGVAGLGLAGRAANRRPI